MPEKIEKILRAIYILMARGETFKNDPDMVAISRREMFRLLEQLKVALAEVMDQYEASKGAKLRAKREIEETGIEIINNANAQAEDIYAGSILFSDGALNELYDEVIEAKAGLRSDFERLEQSLDDRLEEFKQHQKELMDCLRALQQGDKYFGLIEDYNRRLALAEQKEAEREALHADEGAAGVSGRTYEERVRDEELGHIDDIISGKAFEKPVIPENFKKRKKTEPHAMGETGHGGSPEGGFGKLLEPDPDDLEEIQWPDEPEQVVMVDVQYNANWGTKENNVLETSRFKTKKQRDKEKKYGNKPKKKKSKFDFDDEEIVLAEEPAGDPDAPVVITSDDLDAEYERWQQENNKQKRKQGSS